jgi:ubiquinone biosynthesis protein Coq4
VTVHDALGAYFERRGIKPERESIDDWLRENWVYMSVRGRRIPVKPLYGYKKVVVLHDVHHLIAGYDTTWTGELEVAAWELGSGGCGPYALMWFNRVLTSLLGLVFAPRATWRAFQRGRRARNLYRWDCREVLERDLEEIRAWVGKGRGGPQAGQMPQISPDSPR